LITAVVVNWNGQHYLEECLASILDQDPAPAEVILADNHSADGSREFVAERFPQVQILDTGSNGGPGAARNAGVRQASHERVLLVDNDVVLQPGTLRRLAETMDRQPAAAMVQARSLCYDRTDVVHYDAADLHYLGLLLLRNFFVPLAEASHPDGPVGGGIGLCFLTDRVKFQAVGGFHEPLFFYFEDTDFAWRLRLAGYTIHVDPDALVLHRSGTPELSMRSGAAMPKSRTFYHSRNRWAVLLTCLRWRTLLVLLPPQLLYTATHFVFAVTRGHGIAWWQGKWSLLRLAPEVMQWRRAAQRSRRMRDRDLLTAAPLSLNPGIGERGLLRQVRSLLDRFYALYWRLARPLCG